MTIRITEPLLPPEQLKQLNRDAAIILSKFGISVGEGRVLKLVDLGDEWSPDHAGITAIVGPSGSGKTRLLQQIQGPPGQDQIPSMFAPDRSKPIIQAWNETAGECLRRCTEAGLSDPFSWSRTFRQLSAGQQARFDYIARLYDPQNPVVIDEFTTGLDPVTAKMVSWNFQKAARRVGRPVIVATTMPDILRDLCPDAVINLSWGGEANVSRPPVHIQRCTIREDITFQPGTMASWPRFAPLHYAAGPPFAVRQVYTAIDRERSAEVGICILTAPPLMSQARNRALPGEYKIPGDITAPSRLNAEVMLLARIVVLPEYRGIGLGRALVNHATETCGAKYIECSAAMAEQHPFLARSGFVEFEVPDRPIDEELHQWAKDEALPPSAFLDGRDLAAFTDNLSVRNRAYARGLIWRHYHHYVQNRRTRREPGTRIPNPGDERWPSAFHYAAGRLLKRPGYWLKGPLL